QSRWARTRNDQNAPSFSGPPRRPWNRVFSDGMRLLEVAPSTTSLLRAFDCNSFDSAKPYSGFNPIATDIVYITELGTFVNAPAARPPAQGPPSWTPPFPAPRPAAADSTRSEFDACPMDSLRDPGRVAPLEWLWHGIIARGNLTLLTSRWKSGKTTLLAGLLQ